LYNKKCEENARTKIDIDDIEKIKQYKWYLSSNGYAITKIKGNNITIHQILFENKMDHINRDPLDNRRSNLRKCTQQQNLRNTKLSNSNTTGIKGVYLHNPYKNKWYARVEVNQKHIYLGLFQNKRDAAIARLKGERKYFGEFQNKILEKQTMKMFNIKEEELI